MDAEQVVKQFSSMIFSIALNYVRHPQDAEDIYSEVFLTYFKKERTFEDDEHLKAWLIRVTINCAKDFLKNRREYEQLEECYMLQSKDRTEDAAMKVEVERLLKSLTPAQREAVYLYYMRDMTTAKIAEILERSENTIKSDLHRGREKMRELLGP